MGKTSSKVKDKYNKTAYRQYLFRVKKESILDNNILLYKQKYPHGFNALITKELEKYFSES